MKYKILKTTIWLATIFFSFALTSCLKKNESTYFDASQLQDQVILRSAGLSNFKAANLRVDNTSDVPDSIVLYTQLASVNSLATPLNVTIAADDALVASYNTTNNTKFQVFPVGSYKIVSTTITIAAGDHYASTYIVLDQTKFDPTVSYMLPISIKDASGKGLSANQNTIYYNIIGNPIAGLYTQEWIRYNNAAGTGSPNFDQTFDGLFAAVDPLTVSASSGTGVDYLLSFTNTNGVLSNFQVTFDPASVTTAGITITSGPTILIADPIAKHYKFNFTYNNSAGAGRNITDDFTK